MQHPQKRNPKRRRPRLIAVLTILALLAAAAFVLLLPLIRERFPAQTIPFEQKPSTVRTLDTRDAAQLASVTLYPDGQNGYTLVMQDGQLMLTRGEDRIAIDADYQADIVQAVTEINVQDTAADDARDVAEHLEAMGLTQPQCKAVARYADGHEETFEIGGMVYGGTDYYFRWSGAQGVYTCHSGLLETFTLTENLLIPFVQPTVYGSLLQGLTLSNRNGECAFRFAGGTSGSLIAPCAYPLTDETAQTLLTAAQNIRLGAYEARLTDENRAEYGFDDPLCEMVLSQGEGVTSVTGEDGALQAASLPAQTLRFVIGRAEGEFFYTCAYQGDVYLISRFLLETLMQADWQSLISRTPANMGEANLRSILFEKGEAKADVQITRTENVLANNQLEVDSEGHAVYTTTATVNGAPVPSEKLDMLLDRLNTFTVEGALPADAEPSAQPRWRITLETEAGEKRMIEGHRLDVFSDAVAVNGVMCHYVYDEAIDVLMTGLL